MQIAASAFSALRQAAEQHSRSAALQLGLSVTATNQVTAVVQELDPLGMLLWGGASAVVHAAAAGHWMLWGDL